MSDGVKYLVDSNILIDHLNGIKMATQWLKSKKQSELSVSVITRAEVLIRADNEEVILDWLDEYYCYPTDVVTAGIAVEFRRDYKLKLPDAFQVALCQQHDVELVTRDVKDFKRCEGIRIRMPYRV